jgi:hypothetical protein
VFIVPLLKADSKDIPKIVETIVDSRRVAVVGWIVAVIILIASIVLIWILCKVYDKEIARLVAERDRLQQRLLENAKG